MPTECASCGAKLQPWYHKQNYQFARCPDCGHAQLSPLPKESELKKAYEGGFGASAKAHDRNTLLRFAREADGDFPLQMIQKLHLPKSAAILDVGCSFGYDLSALKRAGFERVFGLEKSAEAARLAREVLGLNVYSKISEIEALEMRFDFIYLKHCLEHHLEPQTSLATLKPLLKEGGYLLVGVPNRRSLNGAFGKRWEWVTPPIHIHYFTPRSLGVLFEKSQLTPIRFYSRRGHGLPFLKHFLFFFPVVNQLIRRFLGDPYSEASARFPNIRSFVESTSRALSALFSPLSKPIKAGFLVGEEIWILAKKT